MSFDANKDVFNKKVTIHPSVTPKTVEVLTHLAIKKELPTTRVIEELLKENVTFKKTLRELELSGRFG